MPKLSLETTAVATVTEQVKLSPALRRKLLKEFRTYQALAEQLAPLKAAIDKTKGAIGKLREEAGADKLELEGFKVAKVGGTYTWWDEHKLLTMIDADQLAEVKVKKDKKPHERVTLPGEKDNDE